MKRFFLFLILFIGSYFVLNAQKIKYKDLFILINAKDFDQGESFLRRFMIQDPDHPNANFNMGFLYKYKMDQLDMLKDAQEYNAYADSTIQYYKRANSLITDKEVKKHDEYYQEYYRRDLRTGKYGVKLADIQFDIEKKITDLQERIILVENMKRYFVGFTNSYDSISLIYHGFGEEFSGYNHFLLTSSDTHVEQLQQMSEAYDEMTENFDSYKETVLLIEDAPYNQELDIKPADEFEEIEKPDFYAGRILIHDFKEWAVEASFIITDEITPLKSNMVSYDIQLDELNKRVMEGKMVENELAELTKKMFFEQLRTYDEDPLPTNLFEFKVNEISYYSFLNHKTEEQALDSMNIDFQIVLYDTLYKRFAPALASFQVLEVQNIDTENEFYGSFISERYTNVDGMKNYISGKKTDVDQENNELTFMIDSLAAIARWAYSENDTLPMFVIDTLIVPDQLVDNTSYTFAIDTLETNYWISGVNVSSGMISSYLSNVNYNREIDTLIVNEVLLKTDTLVIPQIKTELIEADSGRVFAVFYGKDSNGFQCSVDLIDTDSSVLVWTKSITPTAPLDTVMVDIDSQLLVLTFKPSEEGEENDETPSVIFLDLTGKVVEPGK